MKVLKATQDQYEILNGYKNGVNQLEFIKDSKDNWVVGIKVKENTAFQEISDILNSLEEIDYSPIIEEE